MSKTLATLGNRVEVTDWEYNDNGTFIELNNGKHTGAALVVWRMEDSERSPMQEAFAHRMVACFNICDGIPIEDLLVDKSVLVEMLQERTALKAQVEQLENRISAYKSGVASECARASIKVANDVMRERDMLIGVLRDAQERLQAILEGGGKEAWDKAAKLMPRLDAITTPF
jgi:BMFP domain-containing protein YqiC